MEHLIKINDRSKLGKAVLKFLRNLAETTKAVSFVDEDDEKITLDELIDAVDEQPLLNQLKAYREKGITDLRIIAKELGFTREDKEDLVLGVMMDKGRKSGLADTDTMLKKHGIK